VPGTVVTVAALHGPKPAALRELLASIAGTLADRLGAAFAPYSMAQVHGTLIGLGGHREESGAVISEQYLAGRGERRVMDFDRVQQLLVDRLTAPLAIRIGGFGPAGPAPFTSQGQQLHERSFSARPDRALVLMGWPVAALESAGQCRPLDSLRRSMTAAGVLHRYHAEPGAIDDDFHLVVGHYAAGTAPGLVAAAVAAGREQLAARPVDVLVGIEQVRLLAADSPTLATPWFSSALPVPAAQVARLYLWPADQIGGV